MLSSVRGAPHHRPHCSSFCVTWMICHRPAVRRTSLIPQPLHPDPSPGSGMCRLQAVIAFPPRRRSHCLLDLSSSPLPSGAPTRDGIHSGSQPIVSSVTHALVSGVPICLLALRQSLALRSSRREKDNACPAWLVVLGTVSLSRARSCGCWDSETQGRTVLTPRPCSKCPAGRFLLVFLP